MPCYFNTRIKLDEANIPVPYLGAWEAAVLSF